VLEGAVNIRDLETQYRVMLPSDQGFETLAGFMLAQFQRIPKHGDSFEYDSRRFTVLEMENRRISRALIEAVESHAAERAGD